MSTEMSAITVGCAMPSQAQGLEAIRAALATMADGGLDGVNFGDHVSFRGGHGNDGLIAATAFAMLEPRLRVFPAVYLLPLRHPVPVARQLATLAALAPDRLVLGVGVGGEDRHEVEVCGVDPASRGRRMDECLEVLRGLLTGEVVTFRGEFFELDGARILPAPSEPIPIVVGGRSDVAIRRAARFGEGWLGIWNSPRRFAAAVTMIGEEAAALGRNDVAWQHGMQVWCGFGSSRGEGRRLVAEGMERTYGLAFESFERYVPFGTPADVAEALTPYVEVGCRSFNLSPCAADADAAIAGAAEVKRLLTR